jgi:hypothetical protein
MKKILLFVVFAFSLQLHSQYYSLKKPLELKFLDPLIETPKEFSFNEQKEYFNTGKLKIKSKLIENKLTEYDVNGNIIREKDNLYDKKITYTYKNKVLAEKKSVIATNKKNITEKEQQEDREISRQINNGATMVSKGVYLSDDKESLETVELDENNNITAFAYKDYTNDHANKKDLTSDNSFKVSYDNGKISEIFSKNETEKLYYDKGLLAKKEYSKTALNSLSQDRKEIYTYHYDNKKNLIAIWRDETASRNGKVDAHSFFMIDSANYDSKNRVIRKGSKDSFTIYKYDTNNNVTETSDIQNNIISSKKEYVYNSQNQIERADVIFYKNGKEEGRLFKIFIYDKNLLKEIQEGNDRKTVLDYDNKGNLIKLSEYRKPYQEKGKPPVDFRQESETKYIWGNRSLSVENKYLTIQYTFY